MDIKFNKPDDYLIGVDIRIDATSPGRLERAFSLVAQRLAQGVASLTKSQKISFDGTGWQVEFEYMEAPEFHLRVLERKNREKET
jgi:hypothetical protein